MESDDECCNEKILEDDEFCCNQEKAINQDALDGSNGNLVGDAEQVCKTENNNKCYIRRLCSDGDGNEEHGEDGDTSVSCNHEIICATAIVHSCNKDRPNNNCQDECLTEDPPAESCENGDGVVNGECGDDGTCLAGIYTAIPGWGDYWSCLGSDQPVGDDVMCTPDPVNGACGAEVGSCDA